ncbi:hypothetical protein [Carnobacterium mobile]|uniref:hypothetical protein n=1 Tax=Carnobacterium mobile TaxID=2750 RepID=UPI000552A27B|nr:hypothetical protein [Carnobacterium mobile]
MKKKLINLVLLIMVPLVLASLAHFIWNVHISLFAGILYIILLLFNLPSGSFMSTNTDYNIKRVNPHYKAEQQQTSSLTSQSLITLAVLILLTVVSFLVYFQQIQK